MIHHDTTPDSQFVVIVMQAFDTDLGSLLDAEFSQQPPPFSTVLWILQELLKATDCFHKQNIILNDIKHLNIVLNRDPPKLAMIDFDNISIAGPDGTSLTPGNSTLGFASWESIVSQRGSFKNDVFAIGMTLFQVITPSKDAVDLPFVTREDFEPYTYHEKMQTSIVRMRWRMKNYTQEQVEVIVRLFANMVAFAETRWTIPELLEFVQMQLQ
jgi:serine/threonine protein kinase